MAPEKGAGKTRGIIPAPRVAARDLEAAHRKALEALERLRAADEELTLVRSRLAARLGVGA